MKEWIEELLAEKMQMEQHIDLLMRLISYCDQEHDDTNPIMMASLMETDQLIINVDQEGVHLSYVSTL
jgi:hypothetical protein